MFFVEIGEHFQIQKNTTACGCWKTIFNQIVEIYRK